MKSTQRVDIQALRGVAVLMVVLYHLHLGDLPSGYLGVDVFFVISGYLITTLIASGIKRGDFSLSEFYFRRAKRLMPAAYVTFLTTALLAPWFLNQQELRDLATQVIGAVTFTSNIVLWQQTGYFEGASELKPLLHTWSLAIEEQYYFLLPVFLLLTRRAWWLRGVLLLATGSLVLCLAGASWKPIATFYLLPTRAWELLIGSVGALWVLQENPHTLQVFKRNLRLVLIPALAALLLLPLLPVKGSHPGLSAILICLATLIVILCNSAGLNGSLGARLLARIGDFSYSLYLVHWPVVAFMKNAWIGSDTEFSLLYRVLAFSVSMLAAYLLYRTVENPIRTAGANLSKPLLRLGVLTSIALVLITPAVIQMASSPVNYKELRRPVFGLSDACDFEGNLEPDSRCRTSDTPGIMVWGDSYAMHLVPGLAEQFEREGIIQATRSQCGPFRGLAPHHIVRPERVNYMDDTWAKGCIAFNQSVLDYLKDSPSIRIVVLSSSLQQYVTNVLYNHVIETGDGVSIVPMQVKAAEDGLLHTVEAIRALGKRVVLIAPPPSSDFDTGKCLERQLSQKVSFGGRPGCINDVAAYHAIRQPVLAFLDRVESQLDLPVIRFDPLLCDAASCRTLVDGTLVYRDRGHLSHDGSRLLAERMQFAHKVDALAK